MTELTHINCVALTARFPVGKPVVPAALMNRPTRGERRFSYLALFPFLAHRLPALGRSAAASRISSLQGGKKVIPKIKGLSKQKQMIKKPPKSPEPQKN